MYTEGVVCNTYTHTYSTCMGTNPHTQLHTHSYTCAHTHPQMHADTHTCTCAHTPHTQSRTLCGPDHMFTWHTALTCEPRSRRQRVVMSERNWACASMIWSRSEAVETSFWRIAHPHSSTLQWEKKESFVLAEKEGLDRE